MVRILRKGGGALRCQRRAKEGSQGKRVEAPDDFDRNGLEDILVTALEFDAVIDPAETRDRILRGLDAFGPISKGQRNFVDTW